MPKKKKTGKGREYSKIILSMMTVFWFLGALYGAILAALAARAGDYLPLDSVLLYVGAPMSGGVVSYMIKTASENKEKIRQGGGNESLRKRGDIQ